MTSQTSQASPKKSPSLKPKESVAAAKNVKLLSDDVTKLKTMNEQLIAKVEDKMNQIKRLEEQINRKRGEDQDQPDSRDVIVTSQTGHTYTVPSVEDIRRMEADLKRKTDLLCEVKVLLKQVILEKTNASKQQQICFKTALSSPDDWQPGTFNVATRTIFAMLY